MDAPSLFFSWVLVVHIIVVLLFYIVWFGLVDLPCCLCSSLLAMSVVLFVCKFFVLLFCFSELLERSMKSFMIFRKMRSPAGSKEILVLDSVITTPKFLH